MTSLSTPLRGKNVGISISNSPDIAQIGLSNSHLDDVMNTVARHLLAAGARLVYGGDLRPGGFTDLLLEFVAMYHRKHGTRDRPPVVNVLAWPVHRSMSGAQLSDTVGTLGSFCEFVFLDRKGNAMSKWHASRDLGRPILDSEWRTGLTALRNRLNSMCDARVVIGGQVAGFRGIMPGIAEEVLLSLRARKPTLIVGGYGGCAGDILVQMGLAAGNEQDVRERRTWPGIDSFSKFRLRDLRNGLSVKDSSRLAVTQHIDEIVTLLLRGLRLAL